MKNINRLKEDTGHYSVYQEEKKGGLITLFLKNLLSRIYPIGSPLKLRMHSMLNAKNPRIGQIFAYRHV